MPQSYFVRVRMTAHDMRYAFDKFSNVCENLVAYEHSDNAENIHCHLMLINCQVSTDSLKNYIRSCGNVPPRAGNKFWSFKTCSDDLDTPIVYMSKGKYDPCYNKSFSPEYLEEQKCKWITKPTLTQTKIQYVVKENPAQAKKRKNDLIADMLHKIENNNTEHILRVIVQVLNDNETIFGRYTVRDYYDTICARRFTEKFIDSMHKLISFDR